MRAAVYCGTRNVYQDMIPSMKSLLIHSNVEKIYFLIEDDKFPYELPPEVECINVSDQKWFSEENCPNMKNRCSYMVLLRVVFTKIFPQLDKILTIDNDTIVKHNVSQLWDIDMTDYYFAGTTEPQYTKGNTVYINMGVAMLNLKKLREDHMDDQLLHNLKTYYYLNAEQGCINDTCQGHILEIDKGYNVNQYTNDKRLAVSTYVSHFAANPKWRTLPIVEKYRNIEVQRNVQDSYDLDFIIPHYNNINGLRDTIDSTFYKYFPNLHVIVVDDCSTNCDISILEKEYPKVKFIKSDTNGGPGAARQIGINNSSSPYIMFVDAGDKISSRLALSNVLKTINTFNDAYIYSFSWHKLKEKSHFTNDMWCLHGSVFQREFLELYNIEFPTDKDTSYCGEDLCFMQQSYLNLYMNYEQEHVMHKFVNKMDLVTYIPDGASIMHTNLYAKAIKGIVYNFKTIVAKAKQNGIDPHIVQDHVTRFFIQLYHDYLRCAKDAPELLDYNMEFIRDYYYNVYQQYEKINEVSFNHHYQAMMSRLLKLTSAKCPRINIHRFIGEIKK